MNSPLTRPVTRALAAAVVVVVSLVLPNAVFADAIPLVETTDYMHARYYSPNLGRFVSVDQVGGSVGSSQSWNRYSYVENQPINALDPDGRIKVRVERPPFYRGDDWWSIAVRFETTASQGGVISNFFRRIGSAIGIVDMVEDAALWYTNDTSGIGFLDTAVEKGQFEDELKKEFEKIAKEAGGMAATYSENEFEKLDQAVLAVLRKFYEEGKISIEEFTAAQESYDSATLVEEGKKRKRGRELPSSMRDDELDPDIDVEDRSPSSGW